MTASALEAVRNRVPHAVRDIRINLQNVLSSSVLTPAQRWGVAVASAIAARNPELRRAVLEDAAREVEAAVLEDAKAAAALMAMNNIYYRFLHLVGKPEYAQKPARLRMARLAQPATNKVDLELFSLAVSAINGCENCMRGHEQIVTDNGLSTDQVQDALRIAATMHAAAVALELADEAAGITSETDVALAAQ
jgi:alkyl hydroperoxide reductase subunit D